MNLAYKKDLRHNYLVIEEEENIKSEAYSIRMLEEQKIEGVLSLEQRYIDNKTLFYYDITGKQSLSSIFEKTALSYDKLKSFLSGILIAIERAYDYLLPEDDFILTPEHIYLDIISFTPELCYLSGYKRDIKNQLGTLLEYLMNKVNYNDKTAVLMVYQLYAVSKEDGFTLQQLSEIIQCKKKEDIPPEGENIQKRDLLQKGELLHKGDLLQKRELLHKGEMLKKGDILPRGDLPRTENLLYSRELSKKAALQNKVELQRRNEIKKEKVIKRENDIKKEKTIRNRESSYKSLINIMKKVTNTNTDSEVLLHEIKTQNPNKKPLDNIPIMLESVEQEQEVAVYPLITYILTCICGIAGGLIIILGFTSRVVYNSFGNRVEYDKLIALVLIILCIEAYLMKKLWDKKNKLVKIVTKTEYLDPREEADNTICAHNTSFRDNLEQSNRYDDSVKDNLQESKRNSDSVKNNLLESSRNNASAKDNYEEDNRSKRNRILKQVSYSENKVQEHSIQSLPETEVENPTCLLSEIETSPVVKSTILLRSLEEATYHSIPITEFPFFIGKLKKNVDYCLEKDVISRFHAKLTREGEAYFLTDLNSKNGTFINQEALQIYESKEIKFGDEIAFANIVYQFEKTP